MNLSSCKLVVMGNLSTVGQKLTEVEALPRGEGQDVSGTWVLNKIRKPLTYRVDVSPHFDATNSRRDSSCMAVSDLEVFLTGQMQASSAVGVEFLKTAPCLVLYKLPIFSGCCSLSLRIWTSTMPSGCF